MPHFVDMYGRPAIFLNRNKGGVDGGDGKQKGGGEGKLLSECEINV